MNPWIPGAIVGGGMAVINLFVVRRKTCARCNGRLPRIRPSTSMRAWLKGQWTCPGCGIPLSRKGDLA